MDESAFKPYENLKNKRKRKIESEKRLSGKEYETVKRKTKISGKKAPSNEVSNFTFLSLSISLTRSTPRSTRSNKILYKYLPKVLIIILNSSYITGYLQV